MKKIISILAVILSIFSFAIPIFAANSGTTNSLVMYLPTEAYDSSQVGMMAMRPRFVGTVVANTTVEVPYNNTSYYAMNYFPFPTNWYNYNNGVYIAENGFNCIPIDLVANNIEYKYVTFKESPSVREIVMELGNGLGGVINSAPDLYFDGLLAIYGDGYSISLEKTGEIDIKVGFNGKLYYSDGSNLITTNFVNQYVLDDENNLSTLDDFIRTTLNDNSLELTDIFFKGSFYIIASNSSDVGDGLSYDYEMTVYGDPNALVYNGTELVNSSSDSDFVLEQFTKLLTSHYSSPGPTPTYPAYSGYTDVNGDFKFYGTYTNGTISVNVPTYAKNSSITVTRNGRYDVGGYNYVEINVPQENVTIENANMFSWLANAAESFLTFEIAPDFSIGGILLFIVGFSLIMWILKIFLGG